MWPVNLSVRLPVVALVSHYLTNKLIGHRPLQERRYEPPIYMKDDATFLDHRVLAAVSSGCPRLQGRLSMYYSPFRRSVPLPKEGPSLDLHA